MKFSNLTTIWNKWRKKKTTELVIPLEPIGLICAVEDVCQIRMDVKPAQSATHVRLILRECRKHDLKNEEIAYVLATALHESHMGYWMSELASGKAYEGRRDLGNVKQGDGVRYKGRGYVQITGRTNYRDWGKRLKLPLLIEPTLASDPQWAATILVEGMVKGTFTGLSLKGFWTHKGYDFRRARRIVNRMDKADKIAGHAKSFLYALQANE